MHYEDLTVVNIVKDDNNWRVHLVSNNGGKFSYPVASPEVTIEQLEERGVVVGRQFLGGVENDSLVSLDGFSYITSEPEMGD